MNRLKSGKVQAVGSAGFLFSENVRMIALWVTADSLPSQGDKVFALAEGDGFLGTYFSTSRNFSLLDAVVTHGALPDLGSIGIKVIVRWNPKGAGHHTIAAAYTYIFVIYYRSFRRLFESFDQTN